MVTHTNIFLSIAMASYTHSILNNFYLHHQSVLVSQNVPICKVKEWELNDGHLNISCVVISSWFYQQHAHQSWQR